MTRAGLSFLLSIVALLAIGLVVLASASGAYGLYLYNDANHFFVRQVVWVGVSIVVGVAAYFFDYHKWREMPWLTVLLYLVVVCLMAAVFAFPEVKGSHRWLKITSSLRLQPSEFGKLAVVIATAVFIDRAGWRISKFWKGAVRASFLVAVIMGLAVAEPDFGATMVIGITAGALFFISGMKILHLVALGVMGGVAVGVPLMLNKNRMNRILSWFKSSVSDGGAAVLTAKEKAVEHQANAALVAIRNGGTTGVGYTKSMQKLQYLPEAHTDFIFAVGAEELGLVFSLALLALYVTVMVLGMIAAARSPDRLGRLIAYGMTFLIVFQALFNLGVVTKCLPTKGIALPFISYGGTNLLTAAVASGIILNVFRQIESPKLRPRSIISPMFETEGA
ncbi:MAG: FtsW/RodA/SpoVE family cell cycle protein [Kiritimatiellae bacterium]|nr:FtsW/RodA/SpoVE family cell cycle protein [Kiritimatiellia bacterium]